MTQTANIRKFLRGGYLDSFPHLFPLLLIVILLAIFQSPIPANAKYTQDVSDGTASDITSTIQDGIYRIVLASTPSLSLSLGETIHISDTSSSTYNCPNICIKETSKTDDEQLWNIKRNADSTYIIESKSKPGYALNYDIHNACTSDTDFVTNSTLGSDGEYNVMAFGVNGSSAQQWSFRQYADKYWFIIQNPNDMVLDVKKCNTHDGANVDGYTLNNSAAQKWRLIPADTDSENITFSIPTTVPCYEKADGSVIAPSSDSWQICNIGTKPITLTSVSSNDTDSEAIESITATATNLKLETNVTDTTKDITDGTGSWTISKTTTGTTTLTATPAKNRSPVIRSNEYAGFDWAIKLTEAGKRKANGTIITPTSIQLNFEKVFESNTDETNGKAFAVYSDTDKSLNFYKRKELPVEGEWFCGKEITNVYTGFEAESYTYDSKPITDGLNNTCNTPWYSRKDDIQQSTICDNGISPKSLSTWFANMLNVKRIDISKLVTDKGIDCLWLFINCRSMEELYLPSELAPGDAAYFLYACQNLKSENLHMPLFDMSYCTRSFSMFANCLQLTSIDNIANWDTSKITDMRDMFWNCPNLTANLTDWDVSSSESGFDMPRHFNLNAPNVTIPKPWQLTAFAIYSPDDNSLDFYKRAYGYMPSVGDTFNGKSVGEIYTGFETNVYEKTSGTSTVLTDAECNTPWFNRREEIKSAKVIDSGIAPARLDLWFLRFTNITDIDLSALDASKITSMYTAIAKCDKLTQITLPKSMPAVNYLCDAFYDNESLETLDLSCFDSATPKNYYATFAECKKLKTLILSDQISVGDMSWCFTGCKSLIYDCSNWDVTNANCDRSGIDRAFEQSPVIRPKTWQAN